MALLVLIVADIKCSVLLVYAAQCTANCVALAISVGTYQLVNDIRARYNACEIMHASVFAVLHSRAPEQSSTSGTECHTVFGWIASPATRYCLSWHWISWRLLPLKPTLNDYSCCVVISQQVNETELGCPCIGGYFWNWSVTFCIELTVLWTEV